MARILTRVQHKCLTMCEIMSSRGINLENFFFKINWRYLKTLRLKAEERKKSPLENNVMFEKSVSGNISNEEEVLLPHCCLEVNAPFFFKKVLMNQSVRLSLFLNFFRSVKTNIPLEQTCFLVRK